MKNNELQGVLFPNKKLSDKHPDYKGSVKVGDVDYYVAAWNRTSKSNKPYLSLVLKRASDKPTFQEKVNKVAETVNTPRIYEEVPF